MPYVSKYTDVEIDVDVSDFYNAMSAREKVEMAQLLRDNGVAFSAPDEDWQEEAAKVMQALKRGASAASLMGQVEHLLLTAPVKYIPPLRVAGTGKQPTTSAGEV
jgi:hypothetical protein